MDELAEEDTPITEREKSRDFNQSQAVFFNVRR